MIHLRTVSTIQQNLFACYLKLSYGGGRKLFCFLFFRFSILKKIVLGQSLAEWWKTSTNLTKRFYSIQWKIRLIKKKRICLEIFHDYDLPLCVGKKMMRTKLKAEATGLHIKSTYNRTPQPPTQKLWIKVFVTGYVCLWKGSFWNARGQQLSEVRLTYKITYYSICSFVIELL